MEFQRKSGESMVAVSGHRVFNDEAAVMGGITQGLLEMLRCWRAERLCVITSLAEGADRLVIQAARSIAPTRFIAVLPMDEADYKEDFAPASAAAFSRLLAEADAVQVLEGIAQREEAYYRAGVAVLDYCDLLLAVWDGQPARGYGGTGDIVQLARERKLPLVWVYAARSGGGAPGGIESGRVRYERFPEDKKA